MEFCCFSTWCLTIECAKRNYCFIYRLRIGFPIASPFVHIQSGKPDHYWCWLLFGFIKLFCLFFSKMVTTCPDLLRYILNFFHISRKEWPILAMFGWPFGAIFCTYCMEVTLSLFGSWGRILSYFHFKNVHCVPVPRQDLRPLTTIAAQKPTPCLACPASHPCRLPSANQGLLGVDTVKWTWDEQDSKFCPWSNTSGCEALVTHLWIYIY